MKLLNKLKFAYLYDLKMEYKLLISHLTLSVLAILLLTALLYTNSARILERKLLNSAEATSEKITLSLENIIQKYDNMTYSFSMMETVTDIFSHPGPDYDYSGCCRKGRCYFRSMVSRHRGWKCHFRHFIWKGKDVYKRQVCGEVLGQD